jgi:hypothetical protein
LEGLIRGYSGGGGRVTGTVTALGMEEWRRN